MHIIETRQDIMNLFGKQIITPAMADYLTQEMHLLRNSLEPEVPLLRFSLDIHGPIVLLEHSAENLACLGLRPDIQQIIPEWVSRKTIGSERYYVLFILADNDFIYQLYLLDHNLPEPYAEWLAEEAETDEQGEGRLPDRPPF